MPLSKYQLAGKVFFRSLPFLFCCLSFLLPWASMNYKDELTSQYYLSISPFSIRTSISSSDSRYDTISSSSSPSDCPSLSLPSSSTPCILLISLQAWVPLLTLSCMAGLGVELLILFSLFHFSLKFHKITAAMFAVSAVSSFVAGIGFWLPVLREVNQKWETTIPLELETDAGYFLICPGVGICCVSLVYFTLSDYYQEGGYYIRNNIVVAEEENDGSVIEMRNDIPTEGNDHLDTENLDLNLEIEVEIPNQQEVVI